MPATSFIIVRVSEAEHEAIRAKSGDDVAGFLRKLLGLPPRKPGRPRKADAAPDKPKPGRK